MRRSMRDAGDFVTTYVMTSSGTPPPSEFCPPSLPPAALDRPVFAATVVRRRSGLRRTQLLRYIDMLLVKMAIKTCTHM